MFTTFLLSLDLSFFLKTLQIQISQLPTWSGRTLFLSLLVNTCSLRTNKNFGRNIVYKIIKAIKYFVRNASNIYAYTHPNPQFMVMAETSPLAFFVAEMSMAKMSRPKRPRMKCPRPKCPSLECARPSWIQTGSSLKNEMQVNMIRWPFLTNQINWSQ